MAIPSPADGISNTGEPEKEKHVVTDSKGTKKTVLTIHRGLPITFQVDLANQKNSPMLTATGSGSVALWERKKDDSWEKLTLPFRIPAEQSAGVSSEPGKYVIQGLTTGSVTLQITVNNAACAHTTLEVRRLDLDVDSDNSGEVDQSEAEEKAESDPEEPGKILLGSRAAESDEDGIPHHPDELAGLEITTANLASTAEITLTYPSEVLRIWNCPPGQTPDIDDLLEPRRPYTLSELGLSSGSNAKLSIQSLGTASGLVPIGVSSGAATDEVLVNLLSVDLAVDADRDGKITFDVKDKPTAEKPYRFWINNDQDDVEVDEPVIVGENERDLIDALIKTSRDLEDFSRIEVSADIPLDQLREGKFKVGMKFKNSTTNAPAIRVWPNESDVGSREYLTDGTAAARQRLKTCFGDTLNGAVFIPQSYWLNRADSKAHLIFEGVRRGVGELVLVVKPKNASEIESDSIHLNLLDVREMYQRARIVNPAESIDHPWTNDNPPPQTWVWDPWNWPPDEDPDAEQVTAVFVHGWRLKYMDFMNWSDSSYKRLWHQGFKGKFYSFRWATFSGDNNGLPYGLDEQMEGTKFPPGGTTYNASEYRAWLCGPQLASFVNQLPNPGRRSLFAHSMGNVIAGAALRSGMSIQQYALCNAAVSAMSYDPNPTLRNDPSGNPWDNIFYYLEPHKTPDTDTDAAIRNSFGLESKFNEGNEMPRIFNFGLPEDSALSSWVLNNLHFKADNGPGGHSYYYQHVPQPPNLTYKLFHAAPGKHPRQITRQPEAMGYVTKSLTRPVGTDLRTRGAINDSYNMASWGSGANHSGFGEVHSAQWRWSYQSTNLFWNQLARELQLTSP